MSRTEQGYLQGSRGKTAAELLPPSLLGQLRRLFFAAQAGLSGSRVVGGRTDRAQGPARRCHHRPDQNACPPARLVHFDQFVPLDRKEQRTYEQVQLQWIQDEEYLLGLRLGRKPAPKELVADFTARQNGPPFPRAYYTLKYPHRMRPRGTSAIAGLVPV